jgi:hypothetical protein
MFFETISIGCHDGYSPSGGVSLVTYGNVKKVGATKLAGTVNAFSEFNAIPPTSKMSKCNLDKNLKALITEGLPN